MRVNGRGLDKSDTRRSHKENRPRAQQNRRSEGREVEKVNNYRESSFETGPDRKVHASLSLKRERETEKSDCLLHEYPRPLNTREAVPKVHESEKLLNRTL